MSLDIFVATSRCYLIISLCCCRAEIKTILCSCGMWPSVNFFDLSVKKKMKIWNAEIMPVKSTSDFSRCLFLDSSKPHTAEDCRVWSGCQQTSSMPPQRWKREQHWAPAAQLEGEFHHHHSALPDPKSLVQLSQLCFYTASIIVCPLCSHK